MPSCKRHVYKTMCEQENGYRTGRTKKVSYESVIKGHRRPKKGGKK